MLSDHDRLVQDYADKLRAYEIARAQCAILAEDQEAELVLRRRGNINARTPRALVAKLKEAQAAVRSTRKAARDAKAACEVSKAKLVKHHERIALLVARIGDAEQKKMKNKI